MAMPSGAVPQTHHRLFARAMGLALTRVPVREAVGSLIAMAGSRPEPLRRAIDCAEESAWRDPEPRQRATALLELAHRDLTERDGTSA